MKQHRLSTLLTIITLAVVAMVSACGKRTPPVPPRERVQQRAELTGFQRGNQVILSWPMPARNAVKTSVLNISRIDIYRLAEPLTAPLQLSEEEFANRSTIIAAMPIEDADFGRRTLSYRDTLEFAGQAARLRYAIRFVNAAGQKAAFSNTFLLEPASRVAAAPGRVAALATQDAIFIDWEAPAANIDGSTPASVIGYNVYRSESRTAPARLLNKTPVTETSYSDEFFEFEKPYFYFVRALSLGTQAEPVESAESNIVEFRAVDKFPPSAPEAITLAAAPGTISIFFAINPERDIAGYHIYRSADRDAPLDAWQRLTAELLTATTYHDNAVEPGRTYHYYLTATDRSGNVSPPSEVVSETVP